jgi:hypothetical protein
MLGDASQAHSSAKSRRQVGRHQNRPILRAFPCFLLTPDFCILTSVFALLQQKHQVSGIGPNSPPRYARSGFLRDAAAWSPN